MLSRVEEKRCGDRLRRVWQQSDWPCECCAERWARCETSEVAITLSDREWKQCVSETILDGRLTNVGILGICDQEQKQRKAEYTKSRAHFGRLKMFLFLCF
jgi:hypothetical protein